MLNAWIKPDGELIACGFMDHSAYAFEVIRKNGEIDTFHNDYYDHMEYMYSHGYREVRQWKSYAYPRFVPDNTHKPVMRWNKQQIKAVVNICIEYEMPIPDYFKEVMYG